MPGCKVYSAARCYNWLLIMPVHKSDDMYLQVRHAYQQLAYSNAAQTQLEEQERRGKAGAQLAVEPL